MHITKFYNDFLGENNFPPMVADLRKAKVDCSINLDEIESINTLGTWYDNNKLKVKGKGRFKDMDLRIDANVLLNIVQYYYSGIQLGNELNDHQKKKNDDHIIVNHTHQTLIVRKKGKYYHILIDDEFKTLFNGEFKDVFNKNNTKGIYRSKYARRLERKRKSL